MDDVDYHFPSLTSREDTCVATIKIDGEGSFKLKLQRLKTPVVTNAALESWGPYILMWLQNRCKVMWRLHEGFLCKALIIVIISDGGKFVVQLVR